MVAYIHALVIDTVPLHHSDTPNLRAQALRTQQLIIDEHGGVDPALWRAEILDCITGYYEGILKMEGAFGVSQVITLSRKHGDKKIPVVTATPIDPAAAPVAAAEAAEAAEAEAAPAPPARAGRRGGVTRIKYLLFELMCPAAAVIQQLSSQLAGPGCCSSEEQKRPGKNNDVLRL
jgi:hypothetical protein